MSSIYWHFVETEILKIFLETLNRPQQLGICVHACGLCNHGLAHMEGTGLAAGSSLLPKHIFKVYIDIYSLYRCPQLKLQFEFQTYC